MSTDQPIIEEEIHEDGKVTEGKNNFSKKMGNALRRSKRLMSGRKKQASEEKENISPVSSSVIPESDQEPKSVTDSNLNGELSPKRSQTFFSSEKQVEIDGKKIKEVEIVGAKSVEPIDMKKQKKLVRKKSLDQSELNVACRDLGKADHEGWLLKKAGGHGLMPVSWKRYWCVVKGGKIYCYKTSFDIAAEYAVAINAYTAEKATEKKKTVFRLKPNTEDYKQTVFAGESEDDVNAWLDVINKVLSGIDISKSMENDIPDYEERKRLYSNAQRSKEDPLNPNMRKQARHSYAFSAESETTGMPAGFGARTSSMSQPRVRKMSSGSAKPESCLAVGSMFKALEDEEDDKGSPTKDVQLKDILYKEVSITPSSTPDAERRRQADLEKLNAEIAKLNSNVGVVNNKEVEEKSESLPQKQAVHAAPIPTVKIQEASPVEDIPKGQFEEEAIQLEVKDSKKTQERSTSQIFRDFESATADDPVPQPEQTEVKETGDKVKGTIIPPSDEDNEEPERQTAVPTPEKPLITEEELTETRKSAEIDAETVITELEEQVKKERNVEAENDVSTVTASENAKAASEVVNISKVLDAESTSEPSAEVTVDNTKDNNEKSVLTESKGNDVSITETIVESSVGKNEADAIEVSHQKHEQVEDELKEKEASEVPSEKEETEVPAENEASEEPVVNVSVTVKVDEPKKDEQIEPKETEENSESVSNANDNVDETKAVETNETQEENSKKDKNANEVSTTVEGNEKKHSYDDNSEVVHDTNEGAVETKIVTLETTVIVETTETKETDEKGNETTVVTIKETTKTDSVDLGEAAVIVETTETKETDEEGNETTVVTITETKKTDSVDLGEDLDVPNLNLADSSLSEEINIELNSPTSDTKTTSITDQSAQESKQLNGGANHVVTVN